MLVVYMLIGLWFILMCFCIWLQHALRQSKSDGNESEVEKEVMLVRLGDKIEIIELKCDKTYNGKKGVVKYIDDFGLLHGTWGDITIDLTQDTIKVIKNAKS